MNDKNNSAKNYNIDKIKINLLEEEIEKLQDKIKYLEDENNKTLKLYSDVCSDYKKKNKYNKKK